MDEPCCSKLARNCKIAEISKESLNKTNLSEPTLNSSLRRKNEIEQLKNANIDFEKSEVEIDKQKLTTKLNFGLHERVFANLTSINVNDSLLLPKEKIPISKKYIPNKDKMPVPDLCDFLDEIPPLKYVIEEPEIKLEFDDYDFDVALNYELFRHKSEII